VPSLGAYKSVVAHLVALLTNFMSSSALPTYSTGNMVATAFKDECRLAVKGSYLHSPLGW
jgi:hypothetical protein